MPRSLVVHAVNASKHEVVGAIVVGAPTLEGYHDQLDGNVRLRVEPSDVTLISSDCPWRIFDVVNVTSPVNCTCCMSPWLKSMLVVEP